MIAALPSPLWTVRRRASTLSLISWLFCAIFIDWRSSKVEHVELLSLRRSDNPRPSFSKERGSSPDCQQQWQSKNALWQQAHM
jgi:hypothetical protein